MSDDTNGRIALVTGANKGIGFEIAAQLEERGLTVLVGVRDAGRREEAVARLKDAHGVPLDVTDQESVDAAAALVAERFGRLDVLVNNAGISGPGTPPSACGTGELREVFDTNVLGVLRVTNAMLPLLRRSPAARIVNVSSGVGSLAHHTDPEHYMSALPAGAAYPASKTALNMLTVQYAKELRPEGILVNAAIPGACATDFTAHLGFDIPRTAAQGAAIAVRLATLPGDGGSGGAYDDDGPVPW
ncbi:SDR family oxidoreductase [Actinomadura sp. 21ATH]|uniref:SDR family oxidoreductase n=1 Tax=Actinomadura sp. 21ATH TaxID=1735444 RepID=UPI0035BEFFD9